MAEQIGDYLYSLFQTTDNGYVLGGFSSSGINGDKTALWGSSDYWILKIDSSGNKQWDKVHGGTGDEDDFGYVYRTEDNGFLMSSTSYSTIGGNKTENNLGIEQTWIVKSDSLGNKEWDKTIFTLGHNETGWAIQSNDGCFVVANNDESGPGGYKTQSSQGGYDFWIIKFCDSTQVPISAFATTTPLCPGTCTSFTNLSTNATTYQWSFLGAIPDTSTAVNPQSICYNTPGSYDVTLIASNANGSDTLTLANYITVFPYPPPQGILQNGDTLFANQGAVSYQWYFNGNLISSATNYFYLAQASGDYNVVAIDANGCEVEAVIFNVIATVVETGSQEVFIFPNPVKDKLVIDCRHPDSHRETINRISICDVIGNKILDNEVLASPIDLDISFLQPGIYFITIQAGEKIFDRKLVKL